MAGDRMNDATREEYYQNLRAANHGRPLHRLRAARDGHERGMNDPKGTPLSRDIHGCAWAWMNAEIARRTCK